MKLLIITGQMRSGTTLLTNYLNSQPNCVVYSDFLMSLFSAGKSLNIQDIHRPLNAREKNILISNLEAENFKFDLTNGKQIKREDFNSWYELFEKYLKLLAENSDKGSFPEVTGIKKTREIYNLKALLQNDVKIIYVYRDPRDVLISAKNRFSYYNLFAFAQEWKDHINNAIEISATFNNFKMIRYEDLLLNKDRTIDELAVFLNVQLDKETVNLNIRKGVNYIHNSSFGDISKAFDPAAAYRWKNQTDSEEVIFSSGFHKKEIEKLGYESFHSLKYNQFLIPFKKYTFKQKLKKYLFKVIRKISG